MHQTLLRDWVKNILNIGKNDRKMNETKKYNWSTKTILIVEDTEENYFLAKEILKNTQVKIIWTKTGEDTLDLYKAGINADLILMDYKLPGINGIETMTQLLRINPDLSIIGLTTESCRKAFMESGAIEFIEKPIKMDIFLAVLNEFMVDKN